MLFGLGIDYLLPQEWFQVALPGFGDEHCSHCLGLWDWIWIAILLVLLVNAFWPRKAHHHDHE
jgi:hypothetical protein